VKGRQGRLQTKDGTPLLVGDYGAGGTITADDSADDRLFGLRIQ